jgi:hypothetical protein
VSVTVTVNGKSGPSVVATSGDTISAAVTKNAVVSVAASAAAAPGGTGPTGPQGPPSTTITVGSVSTLAAGSSATVVGASSNNGANLSLAFGIPAGATGATGVTPTITATTTTLSAGSSATVTATPSDGGSKVSLAFGIPRGADGAAGSGGGATLSDSTPSALGTAAAGTSTTASRSDHVHAVPVISYASLTNVPSTFAPSTHTHTASQVTDFTTAAAAAAPVQTVAGRTGDVVISTTDVEGLSESLASVNVDVIDGGDYVGVVVEPTPSITITAQPANRSASVNSANEVASTLPSGTWGAVSRAYDKWFVAGHQTTQADYVATSDDGVSWTRKIGLPNAGLWSAVQYANGVYATQAGNTVAYSSDLTNWSSSTITFSRGSVFGAGGKFVRATQTGLFFSNDAATWAQGATFSSQSGSMSFAYSDGKWFAADYNQGLRVSTDGATWSAIGFGGSGRSIENAVTFGGKQYIGQYFSGGVTYSSGTWGGTSFPGSSVNGYGCQFATDGTVLVVYSYAGKIFSSTNGTTFVERTLPISLITGRRGHLLHANGKFVLVMAQEITSSGSFTTNPGTIYFTSSNGIDWTQATRTYPSYGSSFVLFDGGYYATQSGGAFSYLQIGSSTAFAAFSVSAFFSGNTLAYQWQSSTDAGTTWSNVSGATSVTLSLSGLTTADNGKRYRCILSATGVASVTTNSATLTVT